MLVEAKTQSSSGNILFLASLAAFGTIAYFTYHNMDRNIRDRFLSNLQYRGRRMIQELFPHTIDEYIALREYDRQMV
jgi:hypothetical protein